MSNLKKTLKEIGAPNYSQTSTIPIWLLNEKMEKDKLSAQLDAFFQQGVKKITVKAERGIIPAYGSRDFWDFLAVILKDAKRKGMEVLFSDDVQYSHPGAASTLTNRNPAFRMQYLSLHEILKLKGPKKIAVEIPDIEPVFIFAMKMLDKTLDFASARSLAPLFRNGILQWNIPNGDWRVFVFTLCSNRRSIGGYVLNSLDPEACRQYFDAAFGPLKDRLPSDARAALKGLLVELPNVAPDTSIRGIPWSENILKELRRTTGIDVMGAVLALFVDNYSKKNSFIRRTYYGLLLRLLGQNFIKPLQDYCSRNRLELHCFLSGGDLFSGETLLRFDYAPLIRKYPFIAGLAGNAPLVSENPSALRLFADFKTYYTKSRATAILGRNRNGVGYSLKDHKTESDLLSLYGVSTGFIDGHYYALRYQGGMRAPANVFHPARNFAQFGALLRTLERKAALLEPAVAVEKVGVFFPGESFYASYNPSNLGAYKTKCQHFDSLVAHLQAEGLPFQFFNEELSDTLSLSSRGELTLTAGGRLRAAFKVVLLPEASIIPRKLITLLDKFVQRGGKVVFFGVTPFETLAGQRDPNLLKPLEAQQAKHPGSVFKFTRPEELDPLRNICLAGAPAPVEFYSDSQLEKRIIARVFTDSRARHFLLHNNSETDNVRAEIRIAQKGHLYYFDMNRGNLALLPASDASKPFIYHFAPGETAILILSEDKLSASSNTCLPLEDSSRLYRIILKDTWEYDTPDDNVLPLTAWNMKINSNRDVNAGFNMAYESYITVEQPPARCVLFLNSLINRHINGHESGYYPVEIAFNGVQLKSMQFFGRGERIFRGNETLKPMSYGGISGFGVDITAHVRRGVNRVTLKTYGSAFSPLLLKYPVLLTGSFEVRRGNQGWMIVGRGESIKYGSWTGQGYPFHCGRIVYRQIFEKPDNAKRVMLRLKNFVCGVEVRVNGLPVSLLPWQPACADISKLIQGEKNKIEIEVANIHNNLIKMTEAPAGLTGEVYVDVYQ